MNPEYLAFAVVTVIVLVFFARRGMGGAKIQSSRLGFLNLKGAAGEQILAEDRSAFASMFSATQESANQPPSCDVLFIYCDIGRDGRISGTTAGLRNLIQDSGARVVMSEPGLVVDDFLKEFAEDPPDKNEPPPPVRLNNPLPPSDLEGIDPNRCIDIQDNVAGLYRPGKFADIKPDSRASDLRAVWMPGDHAEWAFRVEGAKLPAKAQNGTWKVYAVVRIKRVGECDPKAIVFAAGVYDNNQKTHPAGLQVKAAAASEDYRSYLIGTVELNPVRDIWVAPANNPCIKAVWVDRLFLVPAS